MRGRVAALGGLHGHQFVQERVDRVVRATSTPWVRSIRQSAAAACTAETRHPVMYALARHVQRLRHLVDWLAVGAFQHSKASAILPRIVGMAQRFP